MAVDHLFLSFWEICFENLPVGTLTHSQITSEKAGEMIRRAKKRGGLCCLSNSDLCAPYSDRERKDHEALCGILQKRCQVQLSIDDFYRTEEEGGRTFQMPTPLQAAQINSSSPLLVVYSVFALDPKRRRGDVTFRIDPDSVQFHLFEASS